MARFKSENGPQNHAECKASLNAISDALFVIGGKWKLRIIIALADGNKRFNELQRVVEGISPKVLSSELKELELNGFIIRNVYDSTPVTVEYELSEYADSLQDVLNALRQWGSMHRENVKKSMKKKKSVEAV